MPVAAFAGGSTLILVADNCESGKRRRAQRAELPGEFTRAKACRQNEAQAAPRTGLDTQHRAQTQRRIEHVAVTASKRPSFCQRAWAAKIAAPSDKLCAVRQEIRDRGIEERMQEDGRTFAMCTRPPAGREYRRVAQARRLDEEFGERRVALVRLRVVERHLDKARQ